MSEGRGSERNGWRAAVLAGAAGAAAWAGFAWALRRKVRRWHRRIARLSQPASNQEPQPGDILLFHHAHGQSLLITIFTHSPFYHSALYAGDMHVVEARPQGVIHNHLFGREHDFITIPAPQGKGDTALAWAKGRIGAGYDRMDMLVIVLEHVFTHLHLNYAPPGKYTCAEFVATAFSEAGLRLFPDRDLDDVVPADFARLVPGGAMPGA